MIKIMKFNREDQTLLEFAMKIMSVWCLCEFKILFLYLLIFSYI